MVHYMLQHYNIVIAECDRAYFFRSFETILFFCSYICNVKASIKAYKCNYLWQQI